MERVFLLCKDLPKLQFSDENKRFTYIVEADASEYSYGGVFISLVIRTPLQMVSELWNSKDMEVIYMLELVRLNLVKLDLVIY